MANVAEIEGVGTAYAQKLQASGVRTVESLLDQGATPRGRRSIAEKSGIAEPMILKWVNHVDLFRIKGVAGEYAELLEAAGVDTVPELAQRNATNLHAKMVELNEKKHLVRRLPTEPELHRWIDEAKTLPRNVSY